MKRPEVTDWLRNARTRFQAEAELVCSAMQEGAVSLREAHERIKFLERELRGIAEYCSTDHGTLGAIARLAAVRNTAARAVGDPQ